MAEERYKEDPESPRRRRPRRDEDEEAPRARRRRDDDDDEEEERPRRRSRRLDDDDDDLDVRRRDSGLNSVIPYKNPKALIAYYLGVFSLIPCLGLILGPIALVLGILALGYRKKHPTAGGTGHAWAGIILGSLVLLAHLGVIGFVLLGGLKP